MESSEMLENKLNIETLKGGVVIVKMNQELQRMLNDVQDINKKPDSKREMTCKISIHPAPDGQMGTIKVNVNSTLGKQAEEAASIFFGQHEGQGFACERNFNQPTFDISLGDEN